MIILFLQSKINGAQQMHYRHLCKILFFVGLMVMSSAYTSADPLYPINFMRDDNGRIIQINTVTLEKRFIGKGFSSTVTNRGLVLTDFKTGEVIARFSPDKNIADSFLHGAYALDHDRIVISFLFDLGVWNHKTNKFTLYKGKGSGASGYGIQISGVNPSEDAILSSHRYLADQTFYKDLRNLNKGLAYNDLRKGTVALLFHDYEVSSPLFSLDGTRYAFYGIVNNHTKNAKQYMIVHVLSSGETYTYSEERDLHGVVEFTELLWSPTGAYLAGVGPTGFARHSLHIWNNAGKLLARIPLQFSPETGWLPVWSHDEKSVVLFYYDDRTKKNHKILNQEFPLSPYGL